MQCHSDRVPLVTDKAGVKEFHNLDSVIFNKFLYSFGTPLYKHGQILSVFPDTYGTRQLTNTNYGVCVRMAAGYCSIQWQQNSNDPYSFTVSGDTDGIDPTLLGKCSNHQVCRSFLAMTDPFFTNQKTD